MPILFDTRTNTYYNPSLENLKELAKMRPQMVAVRGVYGSITANLWAIPKMGTVNIWVGFGVISGGLDGYQKVTASAGQPIGLTTGNTGTATATTEIKLNVSLGAGKYPAGSSVWIYTTDLELKAPSGGGGGGGGGNILFPIGMGSRNEAVSQFQTWLKNCGYSVGNQGVDGNWGDATTLAASAEGISVINSRAQLDQILKTPCKKAGGGGGGSGPILPPPPPPPKEENPTEIATDNTMLYLGGAIALALLLKKGKNKKTKKRR